MFVQCMKRKLYNYLMDKNPKIIRKYKSIRNRNEVCNLYEESQESTQGKRKTTEEMASIISSFDVISFDIFDTLIFRCVGKPSDLFMFVGDKLDYPNFKEIRIGAERRARRKKEKSSGAREVTFLDIWEQVELETGIDKIRGMEVEFEIEKEMTFGNPYMIEILMEAKRQEKQIIGISDMYLSKEHIIVLLEERVAHVFDEIYVSSEYEAKKSDGKLFDIVKEQLGEGKSCLHIGDNEFGDIKQGKKHGFSTYYYPNVNQIGSKYRPGNMSSHLGSVYKGLVNSYIHNGKNTYSKLYELGFIYGGLIALRYCNWSYEASKGKNPDTNLFFLQDFDIIERIYKGLDSDYRFVLKTMFNAEDEDDRKEIQQGITDFAKFYFDRVVTPIEITEEEGLKPVKSLVDNIDVLKVVLDKSKRAGDN